MGINGLQTTVHTNVILTIVKIYKSTNIVYESFFGGGNAPEIIGPLITGSNNSLCVIREGDNMAC